MIKRKYIDQLVSIKYSDRPTPIYGFVVDYNSEWTLLKYNPFDYIILRHKNIEGFRRSAEEKFRKKVIMLKNQHLPDISDFPLDNLETILTTLTLNFGVLQFNFKSETACYLGKVKSLTQGKLTINYLNSKGVWTKPIHFRPGDTRTIEFDTDYIKSLKMISEIRKPKK